MRLVGAKISRRSTSFVDNHRAARAAHSQHGHFMQLRILLGCNHKFN